MIAPIEASERLGRITDGAVAAGTMRECDSRQVTRRLEELSDGMSRKPAKASAATLAAMGIAVIGPSEPSQEAQSDG